MKNDKSCLFTKDDWLIWEKLETIQKIRDLGKITSYHKFRTKNIVSLKCLICGFFDDRHIVEDHFDKQHSKEFLEDLK